MPLVLVVEGRRVPVDRALSLGADRGCDVVLSGLENRHARVELDGDHVVVRLEEKGPLSVNEVSVLSEEARVLLPGDQLRIGPHEVEVAYEETVLPVRTAELALAALKRARNLPRVIVVAGKSLGAHLDLVYEGRALRVGRTKECDWVLDDDTLSRTHVRLVPRGGQVYVRDLESARGTFLGGSRLEPEKDVLWDPRRSVRIGKTVLALILPASIEQVVRQLVPSEEPPAHNAETPRAAATAATTADTVGAAAGSDAAPITAAAPEQVKVRRGRRGGWRTEAVIAVGVVIIAACVAALLWVFGVLPRTP